ncbi:helicase-related protein [Embleya sp. NPDC059237]|uniref:helicase-related protein n=1 Tax=Embleya sp. NPDC059237 TaxID=3346784 RepID=UPI0036A0CCD4
MHGEHSVEHRRRVLGRFAEPGVPGDLSVVVNVRILGEGIDCPAVDAVAIFDEMSSIVSITQAVGRALRQKPGQGKVAGIVVPVFLDDAPDDDTDSTADSGAAAGGVGVAEDVDWALEGCGRARDGDPEPGTAFTTPSGAGCRFARWRPSPAVRVRDALARGGEGATVAIRNRSRPSRRRRCPRRGGSG